VLSAAASVTCSAILLATARAVGLRATPRRKDSDRLRTQPSTMLRWDFFHVDCVLAEYLFHYNQHELPLFI
jgi:hypothetical protein